MRIGTAPEVFPTVIRLAAAMRPGPAARSVLDPPNHGGTGGAELVGEHRGREASLRHARGYRHRMPRMRTPWIFTLGAGVAMALVRGDAASLPFADASYDAATGHSFLHLLPDSDAVLHEVHRVVRPGGSIAFLEPSGLRGCRRWRAVRRAYRASLRFGTSMLLWSAFSPLHGRYTAETLGAQLTRCGFVDPSVVPALDGLGLVATARRA